METTGGGQAHEPSVHRIVCLSEIASTVSPLYRYFSFPVRHSKSAKEPYVPPCIRCPNCKGCQLHLQFCSGAYGMRHVLAWILRRQPPKAGKPWAIKLHCDTGENEDNTLSRCSVCRFEVGPAVITNHIIHCSREQTRETAERGGRTGTFAGMACPRPLNFIDVYYSIFLATTQKGREKKKFRIVQRTAMRAVAAQARALWEKLTFSQERYSKQRSEEIKAKTGEAVGPRRVPVDWRCPWFFLSLLPCALVGNGGITFRLWLCEFDRHMITSYIIEDGDFWRAKHTCASRNETNTSECVDATAPASHLNWEGEVKCRRCYPPECSWGLISRRHREEQDPRLTILRVRRGCIKRGVTRRAMQCRHGGDWGPGRNDVAWVNKHKTRAQFMALLVAYLMRTTVCGPYRQRHITSAPSLPSGAPSEVILGTL
ncbi:uncharacterized protein Tco025E_02194 [Trypanosoma conorhini]|uniref:Uncharacterized protein n=1 Tax=Trypanosoma conorhini TaxID=83891 RepID=A0A3R7LEI1_9TRYP|nr:uncharacterized protein Tco025E_02194 [Trypanosoma conorhini]RNF25634.1 hypothetical protein Tco025E_02194 [Trypanosoma conorhini]